MSKRVGFGFLACYRFYFALCLTLFCLSNAIVLQAQVISPEYVETQRVLALARSNQGANSQQLWQDVISAAEALLKQEPTHPEANAWIAEAYETLGLQTQAWKYWQKTWLETNNLSAFTKAMLLANQLAEASLTANLTDAAENYYLAMFELDATDPRAYRGLAKIANNKGETQQAERYWRAVLKLEPNDSEALASVTRLAAANQAASAQTTQTTNTVEPNSTAVVPVTPVLTEASLESRYNPAAVTAYRDALRLYEAGESFRARLLFIRATEQDESFKEAWVWLGRTRFEQQSYPLAAQAFERALALDPNDGDVRARLNQVNAQR